MATSGQYSFYELSRLADDVSSAAFMLRHDGAEEDIQLVAKKGVHLCEVLERGYEVLQRQKSASSAADVYTAQSVRTLLQNSEIPPVSQAFSGMLNRISWAKEKASALAMSPRLSEEELRDLETYFWQLSALFAFQATMDHRRDQDRRAAARNAEPMRNRSFR